MIDASAPSMPGKKWTARIPRISISLKRLSNFVCGNKNNTILKTKNYLFQRRCVPVANPY